MEKEKPLWHRIYYEPAFTEVARIVGYSGMTYRDLMKKVEPLKKEFGGQAIDSAIHFLATFEGDTICNVKPLAHVSLRENARKLCFQLLGLPPEHKAVDMYAEIMASGERLKGLKPDEKKAPAKKPKKKKALAEIPQHKAEKNDQIDENLKNRETAVESSLPQAEKPRALMQQYRQAKERHPGMLLLFRIGDFYELFGEDAETAAKYLGLTLTTREGTAMAGFPHHALERSLQTLLKAGHRVAICDRVENARGKEVTRVGTSG